MTPRVSIVIPVYNEGNTVIPVIERIIEMVKLPCEILVVFDTEDDTTVPFLLELAEKYPQLRPLQNTYGRGPAFAIRYGIDASAAPVAVVTMSDGCDDPSQIDQLARLVDRGVVVASASRYARSGQQVGGPMMKSMMSRIAGLSLYWFARVGTRDATNSFKAYSTTFVKKVGIESDRGFELGIELVAKARRYRQPVAEIPTIWLDRAFGESNFKLWAWISRYLHWYFYAFGPRKSLPK
jgi:glycosyltransferase involved in cell wall biosynthesis